MASGSAGEGAGSNTDKKTSKFIIITAPVFATSLEVTRQAPSLSHPSCLVASFLSFSLTPRDAPLCGPLTECRGWRAPDRSRGFEERAGRPSPRFTATRRPKNKTTNQHEVRQPSCPPTTLSLSSGQSSASPRRATRRCAAPRTSATGSPRGGLARQAPPRAAPPPPPRGAPCRSPSAARGHARPTPSPTREEARRSRRGGLSRPRAHPR